MPSFQLKAQELITWGQRDRQGNVFGAHCIIPTPDQMDEGVPLVIEYEDQIGVAFPFLNATGLATSFQIDRVIPYVAYVHDRMFHPVDDRVKCIPLVEYTDSDVHWLNDRPVIVSARLLKVSLVPSAIGSPRLKAISA